MPTFGFDDARLNGVIRYFGATAHSIGQFRTYDQEQISRAENAGHAAVQLLQCQQCHMLGAIPKDHPPAQPRAGPAHGARAAAAGVDHPWLIDPTEIQPGTRMTQFWPDYPKSPYPQMDNNAEMQIRAVRDYLMTLRGGPSPKTAAAANSTQLALRSRD